MGPIGHGSPGETRKAAIYKCARRAVPVSPDQVCCAQEVPYVWVLLPPQALVRPDSSHMRVAERREHPRQEGRRPAYVVVCKDSDFCCYMWKCLAHLTSLIRFWDAQDLDFFV